MSSLLVRPHALHPAPLPLKHLLAPAASVFPRWEAGDGRASAAAGKKTHESADRAGGMFQKQIGNHNFAYKGASFSWAQT